MTPTRMLFLNQGRAERNAAMGHVRVRHALETGVDAERENVEIRTLDVPPFTRAQRYFTWFPTRPRLGPWRMSSVRFHLARSWAARKLLQQQLRADPPDVVHITTAQVGFLLEDLHAKVPCVLSLDVLNTDWVRLKRGLPLGPEMPGYLRPIRPLERRALERAPLNVAWTETVARSIAELAPAAKVATLHPGLDLEAFRPAGEPRTAGPRRVLFVGGRWEAKGGPALVEALRPELGDTIELDVVTTADIAPAPGVTVHRTTPGSDTLRRLFARADVFCLPTTADAVPWVVLEAMACAVPVVSTRVGSIPELVGGGAGIVVEPGDVRALRGALLDVLGAPDRRAAMGAAGRARVEERYDARRNAPALVELLRTVASSASTTRSDARPSSRWQNRAAKRA